MYVQPYEAHYAACRVQGRRWISANVDSLRTDLNTCPGDHATCTTHGEHVISQLSTNVARQ